MSTIQSEKKYCDFSVSLFILFITISLNHLALVCWLQVPYLSYMVFYDENTHMINE